MKSHISIEQHQNLFSIHFRNAVVTICPHQMIEMLSDINKRENKVIELALLWSMQHQFPYPFRVKPEYQLCFGRTIFVLSQREMIELIAQLWEKSPVLMHWVYSDEQMSS